MIIWINFFKKKIHKPKILEDCWYPVALSPIKKNSICNCQRNLDCEKRWGTHEITLESRFPYFPWKYRVWNRVNATPTFKSISWRASTDNASSLFGRTRLSMALSMSFSVTDENLARKILLPASFSGIPVHSITGTYVWRCYYIDQAKYLK